MPPLALMKIICHAMKAIGVPAFWKLMLAALRRAKECSSLRDAEPPRKRSRT